MDYRRRLEARRGVDVRAPLDEGRGMDVGARLDDRVGEAIASGGAAAVVGGAHGAAEVAHELEIERGGDQIDRRGESHTSSSANSARGR